MAEIIEDALSRAVRMASIVRKELKSLLSEKESMVIIFLIPIALISVLGIAAPATQNSIVWIIDLEGSESSQEFIETMKTKTNLLDIYATGEMAPIEPEWGQQEEDAMAYVSQEMAEKTIHTEYLDAYIILPMNYSANLATNGTTDIIIYYDAIDFLGLFLTEAMITLGLTHVQLGNMLFEADIFTFPDVRPEDHDPFEEIDTLQFAAPMMIGLILFFSMQLITTQCIVGDKPLKRMLNTTLRRGEVVSGKIVAYSIIALFQIILTLILMQGFGVEFSCIWIDLFYILYLNSIVGICIGVFISTISKTRLQASQLFLLLFFIMMVIQIYMRIDPLLRIVPFEQTKIGFEKLAYRGLGLDSIYENILNLLGTGLFVYILTLIYIKYIKKEFI